MTKAQRKAEGVKAIEMLYKPGAELVVKKIGREWISANVYWPGMCLSTVWPGAVFRLEEC